jgi:hypothetical protein
VVFVTACVTHAAVGEDTLDTTPAGIYALLRRYAPHTALELICCLVDANPSLRPEAAQVLNSAFVSTVVAPVERPDRPPLDVLRRSQALFETCASSAASVAPNRGDPRSETATAL